MRKNNWASTMKLAFLFPSLLATVSIGALAQDRSDGFKPACEGRFDTPNGNVSVADFAFWVGEWQVYDKKSGALRGFDDIKLDLAGCALIQHWRQLSDDFMTPGSTYRLEGRSISSIRFDGQWRQLWVDNLGSNILLTGGLSEDGVMILQTEWQKGRDPEGNKVRFARRWHWQPLENGDIHNWGEILLEGQATRQTYDIVYRKNRMGGPNAELVEPR